MCKLQRFLIGFILRTSPARAGIDPLTEELNFFRSQSLGLVRRHQLSRLPAGDQGDEMTVFAVTSDDGRFPGISPL